MSLQSANDPYSSVENCERRVWDLSLSNLVGVCLVVSVLLFSTSVLDRQSWRDLSKSLYKSFAPTSQIAMSDVPSIAFLDDEIKIEALHMVVKNKLARSDLTSTSAVNDHGSLAIAMKGFHPGDKSPQEVQTMGALSEILRQIDNDVVIASYGAAPSEEQRQSVHIWRLLWEANLIRAIETADGISEAGYNRHIPIHTTLQPGLKGARLEVLVAPEKN